MYTINFRAKRVASWKWLGFPSFHLPLHILHSPYLSAAFSTSSGDSISPYPSPLLFRFLSFFLPFHFLCFPFTPNLLPLSFLLPPDLPLFPFFSLSLLNSFQLFPLSSSLVHLNFSHLILFSSRPPPLRNPLSSSYSFSPSMSLIFHLILLFFPLLLLPILFIFFITAIAMVWRSNESIWVSPIEHEVLHKPTAILIIRKHLFTRSSTSKTCSQRSVK